MTSLVSPMCGGGFFILEEIMSDQENNVTVPKMFSLLIQMLSLIIEWPKYIGLHEPYKYTVEFGSKVTKTFPIKSYNVCSECAG